MPKTAIALEEEINVVAEYANVRIDIEVEETSDGKALVHVKGQEASPFLVDLTWAMGNISRLPDRTNLGQILTALIVSHPDVKGVGPKHPV